MRGRGADEERHDRGRSGGGDEQGDDAARGEALVTRPHAGAEPPDLAAEVDDDRAERRHCGYDRLGSEGAEQAQQVFHVKTGWTQENRVECKLKGGKVMITEHGKRLLQKEPLELAFLKKLSLDLKDIKDENRLAYDNLIKRKAYQLKPEQTIGGYRILSPLGAGGMGEVWRAQDEKLGREVALKVLPAEFAGDQDRMARFEREAKVLASLNHPNIAAILDAGVPAEDAPASAPVG